MDSVLLIKVISAFIYPLGLVCVFAALSLLGMLLRRALFTRLCVLFAILILVLASSPIVATKLTANLENQYPQHVLDDIAKHDAAIVLGGGLRIPLPPAQHTQLAHGSDRYWYAVQLFRAGKVDKIVLSGGNIYTQKGLEGEVYYASLLLQEWGVPEASIVTEASSRTTAQNQQYTAILVQENDIKSVLLVTSAIHMPRAYNLFRKLPIAVTPASADVMILEHDSPPVFSYIPSASALRLTTVAMHEYYGSWFDGLKEFFRNGSRLN